MIKARFETSRAGNQHIILTSTNNTKAVRVYNVGDTFTFKNLSNGSNFHHGEYQQGLEKLTNKGW
jgi:hypothetical protein